MSASRVLGLVVVSVWLAAGCSSAKKIDVGGTCILNSDCTGSLVCTSGLCHTACRVSTDCPAGQSCMKTSASAICVLPAEVTCSATSSCKNSLLCAPDQHCRTACVTAANCTTSQVCASNFCADPNDPHLVNGQIPPTAAPDAGTYDAFSPDLPAVSPADAPPALSGPEAGVTYDASLDAPAGPDAPAALLDAEPDLTPDLAPDLAPDVALPGPEAGLACTNACSDGLLCTTDTCVVGVCKSTLNPGYCVIGNVCYMDGTPSPTDPCQACTITSSTSLWTPEPEGAPCGTGKSCQSHVCTACGALGQACCGTATPGTCVVGAACNASTNQCQADKAIDISGGGLGGPTFCALFQSGRVRCWGSSGTELGIGTSTASNVAAPPVSGLNDAVQVSVGDSGVCAVRATGAVVCWGTPITASGATGFGANLPVLVPGITNATQVSVGTNHACVRTADSKVLCWGANSNSQFGDGTTNGSSTPTPMLNVADAQKVVARGLATCVLHTGGQVSCAGANGENGQTANASTATNLPTVTNATDLSSSYDFHADFCAVGSAGLLSCWGENYGSPSTVAALGQVLKVAFFNYGSGGYYLAIQQDQSLWALGVNSYGELGDGTFSSTAAAFHTTPQLAYVTTPLAGVVAVAVVGYGSSCLLRTDGSVSCAGYAGSTFGDDPLGDGQAQPAANRTPFVPVVGILPVASEAGQCYDGVDNDGNGKTDLDDPACAQNLGSAVGNAVATVPFTGIFGNYLEESCNVVNPNGGTGTYGGPEAVLTWSAPSGGTFQFDTTGSSFDTVLAAYKGNPLTAAELACNDDGTGLTGGASAIKVQVITGDKLTLVVDSKAAPTGPASFNLNITKQ
jgi:alpha-tubulin suppressor-like RCC1 family protein